MITLLYSTLMPKSYFVMLYRAKLKLRQIQSIERYFVNSDQVLGSWEEQPMESIQYSTFVATLTQLLGL